MKSVSLQCDTSDITSQRVQAWICAVKNDSVLAELSLTLLQFSVKLSASFDITPSG